VTSPRRAGRSAGPAGSQARHEQDAASYRDRGRYREYRHRADQPQPVGQWFVAEHQVVRRDGPGGLQRAGELGQGVDQVTGHGHQRAHAAGGGRAPSGRAHGQGDGPGEQAEDPQCGRGGGDRAQAQAHVQVTTATATDRADAVRLVEQGKATAAVAAGPEIIWKASPSSTLQPVLAAAVQQAVVTQRAASLGLSASAAARLLAPVQMTSTELHGAYAFYSVLYGSLGSLASRTEDAQAAADPVIALLVAGPLGSMYRPNYFSGGYAVHGMTSVPAYPASHGCVRMTVPTMDRMWSSLWVGMPVAIYSS
jgi:hypothetical protein